ncbi:hypothetical protein Tco_0383788 [Tanacetum coccineum]
MFMTIQSNVKDNILATPSETYKKGRMKPRRVQAVAMTIQYGVRGMILAVPKVRRSSKKTYSQKDYMV